MSSSTSAGGGGASSACCPPSSPSFPPGGSSFTSPVTAAPLSSLGLLLGASLCSASGALAGSGSLFASGVASSETGGTSGVLSLGGSGAGGGGAAGKLSSGAGGGSGASSTGLSIATPEGPGISLSRHALVCSNWLLLHTYFRLVIVTLVNDLLYTRMIEYRRWRKNYSSVYGLLWSVGCRV
ncbi:hypothetical protein CC80DRAFT_227152 [Byssothecium circinans]|uniref:Uncharacterized protein n=1 Tax=Byssothecium circinans TaxID=147558 RepID=A0A6A5TCY5_9PLEO|nr:hypothetical protein CC80DRAFT_227152 [Byssothecium circinans]